MTIVASRWSAWAHNSRLRGITVLGLAVLLWLSACGSLPKTYYYTLELPPPPASHNSKTSLVLGVERFRAPELLRDDRIVFYESPTELNYYQYHRWGSDPATMLADLVVGRLSQAGVFREVRRLPARGSVDYVLRGRVTNFEEVDYNGGVKGRVGLELILVRSSDQQVVWSGSRAVERAAEGKGVAGVVQALNVASEQLLDEVLPALVAQAEREAAQVSGQSQ